MKVVVWNENLHEKTDERVTALYPGGIHAYIASFLKEDDIEVTTATLDDEECGLTEEVLEQTDVLLWWGHMGHSKVPDEIVDRVHKYIMRGMGFIALHSAHHSKIFKKLMGTTCNLKWRDGAKERIWNIKPNHPITQGIPDTFKLEAEEMYGEHFDIPEPQEVLLMGWFDGGEVIRAGCTFVRGNGRIFYFQPGHETNPSFRNEYVQRIIKNAVRWACPLIKQEIPCPHFKALEGPQAEPEA